VLPSTALRALSASVGSLETDESSDGVVVCVCSEPPSAFLICLGREDISVYRYPGFTNPQECRVVRMGRHDRATGYIYHEQEVVVCDMADGFRLSLSDSCFTA